ncbi:MAG: hypothetical protein DYG87_07870 [Anaerolineae bacterium CFX3]|nr:hypothetical protein [Anaerolineae bacterium CFX3]MCQ3947094.1 hypothetical protein [Anaerolineae bacterium]
MPAVDLARLKKQAAQLADLFGQPEAFVRALHETLDFYVNRSLREVDAVAPSSVLETYRTPSVILRHIEIELAPLAAADPDAALELADRLWDEGWLEMGLLAASLLGRIPPREERLLPRLTAWTQQVRDPSVRAALLTTSLARLRKETPDRFLLLVSEWLNPERPRLWANGIQALLPLINDPKFNNLPPVFDMLEAVIEAAPGTLQTDLVDLFTALHRVSPTETAYFLRNVIANSPNRLTAATFRRISSSLPPQLTESIRGLVKPAQTAR